MADEIFPIKCGRTGDILNATFEKRVPYKKGDGVLTLVLIPARPPKCLYYNLYNYKLRMDPRDAVLC